MDADPPPLSPISSGVPSAFLNRTSPLIGFSVVFTRTSVEPQPPPSVNCGTVIACVVKLFTFATGVGLVLYGYRNTLSDPGRAPVGAGAFVRVAGRLRGLFREFF